MSAVQFFLFLQAVLLGQLCQSSNLRYADLGESNVKKALCMADFDGSENNCIPSAFCKNLKQTQGWTVCLDDILAAGIENCLIYSVGVADEYGFDLAMGEMGCEVHAFDPTCTLPEKLGPNVTFHHWGLYGGERNKSSAMTYSNSKYGRVEGEMFHLGELIAKLGHTGRNISIFKIDCEGCEWEVFGHMHAATEIGNKGPTTVVSSIHTHHHSGPMDQIKQLLIEQHYSEDFVKTDEQVVLIGRTFDTIFGAQYHLEPFVRFYVHNNPGGVGRHGYYLDELTNGGFPTSSCCREMGLIRRPVGYTFTSMEVAQVRGIVEGDIFRGHDQKEVYLYKGGKKRLFMSGKIFERMGYDYENIKVISSPEVGLIPSGEDLL